MPGTPTQPSRQIARRRFGPGFTIVEMVCVVVIVGVAAGMIVPRLLSTSNARAQAQLNQVAAMLSAAAVRQTSSDESQRLEYDGKTRRLSLMVRRVRGSDMGAVGRWNPDVINPQITLEDLRLAQTVVDGQTVDERGWTIQFTPGMVRPTIEMLLTPAPPDGKESRSARSSGAPAGVSWSLALLPYASSAQARRVGDPRAPQVLQSIDLDAAGLGDRPW